MAEFQMMKFRVFNKKFQRFNVKAILPTFITANFLKKQYPKHFFLKMFCKKLALL